MGNFTGDKPKFDLVTASKTKKYKVITAVVLIFGLLFLGGGLLMRGLVTSAVAPNSLQISQLTNLQGSSCVISQDELFCLSTGTLEGRALSQPIIFELSNGAEDFVEVWNDKMTQPIMTSNYPGMFYLHIKDDAPEFIEDNQGNKMLPTGKLTIRCGSYAIQIDLTFKKI